MMMAFTSASDRSFLFELLFDAALPGTARLAHEAASSTLVLVQLRPLELQMAFVAAFHARVRVDITRAEAARCAGDAHCFTLVPFCIVQHILVELVSLQLSVAGVAAPRFRLVLALDAVFCSAIEGAWNFHFLARRATVAGSAA